MKVGVIGSMQFTEKMIEARDELIKHGHNAFVTNLATPFIGKTDEEKESIKIYQKHNLETSTKVAFVTRFQYFAAKNRRCDDVYT